jgi:hypothetical protein
MSGHGTRHSSARDQIKDVLMMLEDGKYPEMIV